MISQIPKNKKYIKKNFKKKNIKVFLFKKNKNIHGADYDLIFFIRNFAIKKSGKKFSLYSIY